MINTNVTLSITQEGKIQNWNNFNHGLVLISRQEPGPIDILNLQNSLLQSPPYFASIIDPHQSKYKQNCRPFPLDPVSPLDQQEKLLMLMGLKGHAAVWKSIDNQVIKNFTIKS